MIDQAVVDFAVYEDSVEYLGMASVTLPTLTAITQNIQGAGIAGIVEAPVTGQFQAMTLSLSFRTPTTQAMKLAEPRRHQIDLRAAIQYEDPVTGTLAIKPFKHILVVVPKTLSLGKLAPASSSDGSGDYSVRYWAIYSDGVKVMEVDPLNVKNWFIDKDYSAEVAAALGK